MLINKYAVYGVALTALIAVGTFAVEKYTTAIEQLQEAKDSITELTLLTESYKKELDKIQTKILEIEEQRVKHDTEVQSINSRINKSVRDLNELKGREKTILAKPGLVEIKINKAFDKQQKMYACLTGDKTLCEQQ